MSALCQKRKSSGHLPKGVRTSCLVRVTFKCPGCALYVAQRKRPLSARYGRIASPTTSYQFSIGNPSYCINLTLGLCMRRFLKWVDPREPLAEMTLR
jgi:hypothetical protein